MLSQTETEQRAWRRLEHHAAHDMDGYPVIDWRRWHRLRELTSQHLFVMRRVVQFSIGNAAETLVRQFADIELHQVMVGLIQAVREMVLVYAVSVTAGATLGAVLTGGVGALVGATAGAEAGTLLLGALGLKCLGETLLTDLKQIMPDYQAGIRDAWQAVSYDRRRERVVVDEPRAQRAQQRLTLAHVELIKALLIAIALYASRGQLKTVIAEARAGSLGARFADWLERHGEQLQDHPALQPKGGVESVPANALPTVTKADTSPRAREPKADTQPASSPLTNKDKALLGEAHGRTYMEQHGFERISGDKRWNAAGVDDIWKNHHPPPDYVITEYKYGTGQLGQTKDGLQMSDDWLGGSRTGFDRIASSIGKDAARDVRRSIAQGRSEKWLIRVNEQQSTSVTVLD